MTLRWNSRASLEFVGAIAWYEENAPEQAAPFVEAVEGIVARIEQLPLSFPTVASSQRGARRALVKPYPYSVVFRIRPDGDITIAALVHVARGSGATDNE